MPRFNPIRGVPAAATHQLQVESSKLQVATPHSQVPNLQPATCTVQLKHTTHTKRQCPIWIGQLTAKVPPKEFSRINRLARAADGYWSSYGPVEIHGFIFFDEAKALAFQTLVNPGASEPTCGAHVLPSEPVHAAAREPARVARALPCPCVPAAQPATPLPAWRHRVRAVAAAVAP